MRTRLLVLLPALAGMVAAADLPAAAQTPATAPDGFRVCNLTGGEVEVAKALNVKGKSGDPNDIISEGWYKFAAGECAMLWTGKLKYRYYLLYAQNKKTKQEWAGEHWICVSREPFTIRKGICDASQYRRRFFQVDTGKKDSWTQNLRP